MDKMNIKLSSILFRHIIIETKKAEAKKILAQPSLISITKKLITLSKHKHFV